MVTRSRSAMKRVKSSKRRKERNLAAKKGLKNAFKAAERAILAKSAEARDAVKKAVSIIDKAAERGIIHRNKAARKKSRLLLKLGTIKG